VNEYEIIDAMASFQSNLIQGQALTISMLTAYMIVAYTVGTKLTTFQCVFASGLFLLFGLLGISGQLYNLSEMYHYGNQLGIIRGESYEFNDGFTETTRWIFIVVRLTIFLGALYFMWSVRHPKTE
jgi:hypothetical protein